VSAWDDPALTGQLGDQLADALRTMVRQHDAAADRSRQTDLGPSEIGNPCTWCLAAQILGVTSSTWEHSAWDDGWRAVVGTATHAWLDEAAAAFNVRNNVARWLPEVRVHPDARLLPSGGSCDLFDSETHTVIDHKTTTKAKLANYRLNGPGLQYRRQAHLYGKGYRAAGHDVHHVALAFWLRDGMLRDLYVWTEPYSEQIADETLARYDALRALCESGGPAVLDSLPPDPDCAQCSRRQQAVAS
jgi:hypothetical protein